MMCSARLVCERSRLHALHVRVAAEPTPNRKLCVNAMLASCLAWLLKTISRVPVCCERHACVLSYHHAGIRASQPSACALIASTLAKACICSSLPLRCVRCGVFRMMCERNLRRLERFAKPPLNFDLQCSRVRFGIPERVVEMVGSSPPSRSWCSRRPSTGPPWSSSPSIFPSVRPNSLASIIGRQ